jgi:hypothetical protein
MHLLILFLIEYHDGAQHLNLQLLVLNVHAKFPDPEH